jgi:flagellar basal body rod protein FlgB
MSSIVSAPEFAALSRALDVASLRQAVHTANIANADVPDYQRLEVTFDEQVQRIADELDPEGVAEIPAGARVTKSADETVRLDKEMALMAKDAAQYQTLLGAFERSMGLLQMAIKEGREG